MGRCKPYIMAISSAGLLGQPGTGEQLSRAKVTDTHALLRRAWARSL